MSSCESGEARQPHSEETTQEEAIAVSIKSLSNQQKEEFKMIASDIYGHSHFKDARLLSNQPPSDAELLAYIELQIRDGIHISFLEDGEKIILKKTYGDNWPEKFGYTISDITQIVTILD